MTVVDSEETQGSRQRKCSEAEGRVLLHVTRSLSLLKGAGFCQNFSRKLSFTLTAILGRVTGPMTCGILVKTSPELASSKPHYYTQGCGGG